MATANTPVLADYREQKKRLDKLANEARKQLQSRYVELLNEAAGIQTEFKENFGENPALPACVRSFSLADNGKKKDAVEPNLGKKIGGLRRSLNAAIKHKDLDRIAELTSALAALGVSIEDTAPDSVGEEPAEEVGGDPAEDEPGPVSDTEPWM